MTKKVATMAIGLAMVVTPAFAMAEDIGSLQARIQQLRALVAQLMAARGMSSATPASSSSGSCVTLTVNMGPGATDATTGGQVTKLQQHLVTNGYMAAPAVYGTYDTATFNGVGKMQLTIGIVNATNSIGYGYAGPRTRVAITCAGNLGVFKVAPFSGFAPFTPTFTGTSGNYTYSGGVTIDYGDGTQESACASNAKCPSIVMKHTYTYPGTYSARLVGLGASSQSALGAATVVVMEPNTKASWAIIDPRTLTTTLENPTISGLARYNTNGKIGISISNASGPFYDSGDLTPANGAWSHKVATDLAPGSYTVTIIDGGNTGPGTVLATAQLTIYTSATLHVDPTSAEAGESVEVTWSNVKSPTTHDWIGLFKAGETTYTNYLAWIYTSCTRGIGSALNSGDCDFVLPSGLASGDYQFIMLRNDGYYNVLGKSETLHVEIPSTAAPTAAIDAASLNTSSSMPTITGEAENTSAVSFVVSQTTGTNVLFSSGTLTVTDGEWEGTISSALSNGTYTVSVHDEDVNPGQLLTTGTLTVNAGSTPSPTITATPSSLAAGASATVTWSDIQNPTSVDWIGMYPSSVTSYNSIYITWRYVNCKTTASSAAASGSCTIPIPAGTTPGDYKFVLFASNGYTALDESNTVTITGASAPTADLKVNGEEDDDVTIDPGQSLTYTWNGTNAVSASASYTSDSADYCRTSSGSTDSSFNFQVSTREGSVTKTAVAPCRGGHTYTVTYTVTGSDGRVESDSVTIHVNLAMHVLPTSAKRGDTVEVSWANIPSASATDWIGMYPASVAKYYNNYLQWKPVTCSGQSPYSSGSCAFTIGLGYATGDYKFVYFRQNNYNPVASTENLTVTQ